MAEGGLQRVKDVYGAAGSSIAGINDGMAKMFTDFKQSGVCGIADAITGAFTALSMDLKAYLKTHLAVRCWNV